MVKGLPSRTPRTARPPTKVSHPKVARSPTQPRTSAKGSAAPPVGPLGRLPAGVRSQSNGNSRSKGG